ncbi:potassium channel, subfamily K, member 7 [Scophthalmus maximus]|uniref:potassium channel, subfamily K, member 7 n=1 Tax=Scophthalmus maximus TaxID=52904 RepID=UPI001FA8D4F9|nr:potassium channel, subfamily K, member 7 [Scophthalmus maximus]XP_035483862.2 potassium channel, subfamily K, member 7 [Scophthalmus maximus]XP_035483885.2 potassium channel, subfamily K, member 7 [Scophthalmus maximus]
MARQMSSLRLSIRANAFTCLAVCYLLFVLLGGAVFSVVEEPLEREMRAEVEELRRSFLRGHPCVEEGELSELLGRVLAADAEQGRLDFASSLYFVIVTLTTMGSDSYTPKSDDGKLFCIFYCALGIPSTLFLLSRLSNMLLPVVTHSPVQRLHTHWALPYARAALVHASLLSVLLLLLLFFLPALLVCMVEPDWSFVDALFFCFVTLSTVGEGGASLGESWGPLAKDTLKLLTTCYLLVGLVLILTFRDTVLQVPQVSVAMRLFSGSDRAQLDGVHLSELTLSEDNCAEEPQYSQSVCTISSAPFQLMSPCSDLQGPKTSTLENTRPSQL